MNKKNIPKALSHDRIIFWMLDHAFGTLRYDDTGKKVHAKVLGIDLMPATRQVLDQLTKKGWRSVVLTPGHIPAKALAVIKNYVPELWQVLPMGRNAERSLQSYGRLIPKNAKQRLFISADVALRTSAVRAGFSALPHPALASLAAKGDELCLVRISGERGLISRLLDVVPYAVESSKHGQQCVLAAMPKRRIVDAVKYQLDIEPLCFDFGREEAAYLVVDQGDDKLLNALKDYKILRTEARRLLIALEANAKLDVLSAGQAHGALQGLSPNPELLKPLPDAQHRLERALSDWPLEHAQFERQAFEFELPHILWNCPASASDIQSDVNRYSGVADLDAAGPVASRHVHHPDNSRVVDALIADLSAMGYCAYRHAFTYGGQTLHNVIADLPGRGYYFIEPPYVELIRELFIKHPLPDPPDPWLEPIREILGQAWFKRNKVQLRNPQLTRAIIEQRFQLQAWYPWWRKLCRIPGIGAELVVLGAHLDSSASNEPGGYNAAIDPAPGADDNASGMAATLAIARYLAGFSGQLTHTVRFCFFNAEEVMLKGSQAYAALLKASGAPVRAAVCCDMLGYNSDSLGIFEIHAGHSNAAVRDLSVPVADKIATWATTLGALQPAQIYKGTQVYGGTDRDLYDGAIGRSDHASFHDQGYPAVLVSKDYFANMAGEPYRDRNPNYHTASDSVIDSSYVANIACAVAFAVKELAQ